MRGFHLRQRVSRVVRSAAVAAAAVLVVGSVGAVAAGRIVYFGSPPVVSPAPDGPGTIRIQEPLVASQLSAFRLVLANQGTSTLTQVAVSGGNAIAVATNAPAAPYLTPGASFVAVLPAGPGTCSVVTVTAPNDGFACAFPNLAKGDSVEIQVAVRAQPTAGPLRVVTSAQVKENRNDSGANPDTFYAVGGATALGDNVDSVSTFLDRGQSASVLTPAPPAATNLQRTNVVVPGAANGQPVGITEVADPSGTFCAAGYSCFGEAAIVSVNYGSTVTPYLEWKMEWDATLLPKSYNERKGGVVHRLDDGTLVVIPVRTLCSAKVTTDCVVSFGYSPDKLVYSIVFRTLSNGGTRGF
jgi:hypothetical protein